MVTDWLLWSHGLSSCVQVHVFCDMCSCAIHVCVCTCLCFGCLNVGMAFSACVRSCACVHVFILTHVWGVSWWWWWWGLWCAQEKDKLYAVVTEKFEAVQGQVRRFGVSVEGLRTDLYKEIVYWREQARKRKENGFLENQIFSTLHRYLQFKLGPSIPGRKNLNQLVKQLNTKSVCDHGLDTSVLFLSCMNANANLHSSVYVVCVHV